MFSGLLFASFEKVVFEKAKNLVIYTVIHFRPFSFLIHLQHFYPHLVLWFWPIS